MQNCMYIETNSIEIVLHCRNRFVSIVWPHKHDVMSFKFLQDPQWCSSLKQNKIDCNNNYKRANNQFFFVYQYHPGWAACACICLCKISGQNNAQFLVVCVMSRSDHIIILVTIICIYIFDKYLYSLWLICNDFECVSIFVYKTTQHLSKGTFCLLDVLLFLFLFIFVYIWFYTATICLAELCLCAYNTMSRFHLSINPTSFFVWIELR